MHLIYYLFDIFLFHLLHSTLYKHIFDINHLPMVNMQTSFRLASFNLKPKWCDGYS
jgi:hypothetical protein